MWMAKERNLVKKNVEFSRLFTKFRCLYCMLYCILYTILYMLNCGYVIYINVNECDNKIHSMSLFTSQDVIKWFKIRLQTACVDAKRMIFVVTLIYLYDYDNIANIYCAVRCSFISTKKNEWQILWRQDWQYQYTMYVSSDQAKKKMNNIHSIPISYTNEKNDKNKYC